MVLEEAYAAMAGGAVAVESTLVTVAVVALANRLLSASAGIELMVDSMDGESMNARSWAESWGYVGKKKGMESMCE